MQLDDAARLFRTGGPTGVQLQAVDVHQARAAAAELALWAPQVMVRDWTRTNRNWFDAVQVEKRMMFIILTLIVAVAAFNLVHAGDDGDRQARRHRHPAHAGRQPALHHGHLRRAGRPRASSARCPAWAWGCWWPSTSTSSCRPSSGAGRGLPAGQHLRDQPHAQRAAGPTSCRSTLISLVLAFVATLYPSWRASRVNPAEALRYE
jgi:lipoprotein-releasing system permease protein